MIVLHLDPGGPARLARLAAEADGDVYAGEAGLPLADYVEDVGAWLRAAARPVLVTVPAARAGDAADRRALRALRGMAKARGVDVHLAGDEAVRPVADHVVAGDDEAAALSAGPGAEIARLQQSETMTPLVRVEAAPPGWREIMAATGCDEAEARRRADWMAAQEIWVNDLYQVNVEVVDERVVHLIIRRLDRQPVHNWRHFQEIKNAVLGPDCEAVELYPAESRLVDEKDHYHLWGLRRPGETFGVGFAAGRRVRD